MRSWSVEVGGGGGRGSGSVGENGLRERVVQLPERTAVYHGVLEEGAAGGVGADYQLHYLVAPAVCAGGEEEVVGGFGGAGWGGIVETDGKGGGFDSLEVLAVRGSKVVLNTSAGLPTGRCMLDGRFCYRRAGAHLTGPIHLGYLQ